MKKFARFIAGIVMLFMAEILMRMGFEGVFIDHPRVVSFIVFALIISSYECLVGGRRCN